MFFYDVFGQWLYNKFKNLLIFKRTARSIVNYVRYTVTMRNNRFKPRILFTSKPAYLESVNKRFYDIMPVDLITYRQSME